MIDERVTQLSAGGRENDSARYVLYWMQMYKRTTHNHALDFAVRAANERGLPLVVYEGLKYYYPWANDRLHTFILEGVEEKRVDFTRRGIRYLFCLQRHARDPRHTVAQLAAEAALVVTDDFPCFIIPEHNRRITEQTDAPVYAVDSNGIVPLSAFTKEEYAARTIRPKIKLLLPRYLKPMRSAVIRRRAPRLKVECPETIVTRENIAALVAACDIDHTVKPSPVYRGGMRAARARLRRFVKKILPRYDETRSDPSIDGTSRLSAYLHFGFISALEIAQAVEQSTAAPRAAKDAYFEELIVRRELAYNFTRFNAHYNSLDAVPEWAKRTMREHDGDARPALLTPEQIEFAQTYDELWDATERELLRSGEIHNYVRMLWGKRVIEWQETYEQSFRLLEHINNKYALDGRNPSSYAGILWCFGKHDRAWGPERDVYGKLRFMSSQAMARKFDARGYIEWTKSLPAEAGAAEPVEEEEAAAAL